MTESQAIEYIHSREKFGSVLGLERISALCERLGSPQKNLRFVHVAGTNGKGSVSTMISQSLIDAGYNTGLFTSPFVIDFKERIQLNGRMISSEDLAVCTYEVKNQVDALEKEGIVPTEFEILTAIAFLYYYKKKCDIVVLEVGMGGLYDATNIIENTDVCVITSISLDHTAVLGNTVAEIAFNKAGIIKDNSCVAVYPQLFKDAEKVVFDTAKEHGCKLLPAEKSQVKIIKSDENGSDFLYKNKHFRVSLIGEHQVYNAITAYEACALLKEKGFDLSDDNIKKGISSAHIPARVQIVSRSPLTVIDGGHNADGVEALCRILTTTFSGYKISALMGMMKDKDVDTAVKMLAPLCKRIYTATVNVPRSMSAAELMEKVSLYCDDTKAFNTSEQAFTALKSVVESDEMLLVCGSLYLAGEVENFIKGDSLCSV
ncbi:MAG: bifunctional folylpolyglutamate synthase/dihydrofolate synthase [Clostridia bacterium]|nr:bifunctional folylpolyglutamate synthase/dihydrofolate synthase [Clostridia bacterium]